MKPKEINSLIQLEEANLAQLPKMVEEKKNEMTAKDNELMMIQSQKDKTVGFINPGSLGDRLPRQSSTQADSTQLMGWPKSLKQ